MFKNFPEQWQDLLKEKGITTETAIQKELFTPITEGDNILGISPTGTGKTLAYLLPLLLSLKPKKAQQLLILAPNSELAGQIFDVTKQWGEPLGITAQLFLSGSSQKRQIERLKKGPEILIGTPGRVFELIKLKKIKMMNVNTIVLDEFDELLSDSQYHFVTKISHHVPRDHQMIYISATNKIDSQDLVENTIVYDLSDQELDTIKHYYISVDNVTVSNFFVSSPIFLTSVALSFSIVFLILGLLKNVSNLTELQRYHWLVTLTLNSVRLSWKNSRTMRFHSY